MVAPSSRRLARLVGGGITLLGDLIFLPGCLRCRGLHWRRRAGVCLSCWAAVRPARRPSGRCLECTWESDPDCLHAPSPWSWSIAAITYQGAARDLIHLYKFGPEGGRAPLALPLACLLASALLADGLATDVELVVPVPSHRARRQERGFDAAGLLARHVASRAGLTPPRRLLRRHGSSAPRALTPETARSPPREDYLLCKGASRSLVGRTVLIIDDVCTTGATLRRCAQLLLDGGAAEVRMAVLAFTPRRFFAGARSID